VKHEKENTSIAREITGELYELLSDLQNQYFRRRFTSDPKRIPNPSKYQEIRRQIARIKTVLNERSVAEES